MKNLIPSCENCQSLLQSHILQRVGSEEYGTAILTEEKALG